MCEYIALKFWHNGYFKHVNNGELVYEGGRGKSKQIDPDLLSFFDIMELAKECCSEGKAVVGLYYLVPGLSMTNGLRKVHDDADVMELAQLGVKYRCVELYVKHRDESPVLEPMEEPEVVRHFQPLTQASQSSPKPSKLKKKKMTPKRGPPTVLTQVRTSPRTKKAPTPPLIQKGLPKKASSNSLKETTDAPTSPNLTHNAFNTLDLGFLKHTSPPKTTSPRNTTSPPHTSQPVADDEYDWLDDRPDSPLRLDQLCEGYYSGGSDDADPNYDPLTDKGKGVLAECSDKGKGAAEPFFDGVCTEDEQDDEFDLELENGNFLTGLDGLDAELEDEAILDEGDNYDSEISDEEYSQARERVKSCTTQLVQAAAQLAKEAIEGKSTVVQEEADNESDHESEYEDTEEEENSPPPSDAEGNEGSRTKRSALLVSPDTDFSQFTWRVGLRFAKRDDFREAVSKYAVFQGKNLVISNSNKNRGQTIEARCIKGCPFRVYGSWHTGKAAILIKRVCNNHTCQRNMKKNRQLKAKWVAQQFLEVFKTRPHWPAKEIVECIKRAYKMIVNRVFAYKVKYAAHKLLHGSMHDHYQKVGGYLAAVQKSSPGSHMQLITVQTKLPTPVFQRLFMCFEGLAKGWKEGCRKVLAVDACFLKTFLGGQLLCAVGRDANDQMYPVAWAVTEGENNLSWEWFFKHIQSCLELGEGDEVAIISDEHQAILNAVSNVLPKAEHRHCAKHIYAHWNKTYRGDEFKLQFWNIAKSYSMADYDEALSELAEISTDAAEAFTRYNPPSFCRAFMKTSMKTDAITSNIAETFNGYIIQARTKHLLYMLEEIRTGLMQRLVKKRQEMTKCTTALCPRIQNKLNKEKNKAAYCNVYPSSDTLFNVSHNMDQLVVNLEDRRCSCRKWDMLGIPCCHACACIFFLNQEVEAYVDPCYTRENYLKAYAGSIPPIEGERYWPKVSSPLAPPPIKIGPGRPRKNRIKDPFENPQKPGSLSKTGIQMSCSVCKSTTHNKRKCPNKPSVEEPSEPPTKKPRGRPRKDGETPQAQVSAAAAVHAPPHHDISAQPTQLGRGGRLILGGRGARGGQQPQTGRSLPASSASGAGMSQSGAGPSDAGQVGTQASGTGRAQGRGAGRGRRGGRGQTTRGRGAPRGVGVLFGDDGSVLTNVRGKSSRELAGTATTIRSRKTMSQQATNYLGGLSSSQQSNQPHQTQ